MLSPALNLAVSARQCLGGLSAIPADADLAEAVNKEVGLYLGRVGTSYAAKLELVKAVQSNPDMPQHGKILELMAIAMPLDQQ